MAEVIETAWRNGARFDGWMENFNLDVWHEAVATCDLDMGHLYRDIPLDEPLPWDFINVGVPRSYQEGEWQRAQKGLTTQLCESSKTCNHCQSCSPDVLTRRFTEREENRKALLEMVSQEPSEAVEPAFRYFYRFLFTKTGLSRFISHLDLMHVLQRGMRMAGLPVAFTRGFNPRPVVKFGPALELGVAGEREPFIGEFTRQLGENVCDLMNPCLPEGIQVMEVVSVELSKRKQLSQNAQLHYQVTFPGPFSLDPHWRDTEVVRQGKRGERTIRLGDMIIRVEPGIRGEEVQVVIRHGQQDGSLRISEAIPALFPGMDPARAIMVRQHISYELEEI